MPKETLSKKDIKTLEKELNKELSSMKPKDRSKATVKSKVTRAKTKAETPTTDLKDIKLQMKEYQKEKIQDLFMKKAVRDLEKDLGISNIIPGQLTPQMKKVRQSLLDKIPGDQLANMDENQFIKLAKAEMIAQNPSMVYATQQQMQPQINPVEMTKEIVSIAKALTPQQIDQNNDVINNLVSQLIDAYKIHAQNQPQPQTLDDTINQVQRLQNFTQQQQPSNTADDKFREMILNQNKQLLDELKERDRREMKDLREQAASDPFDTFKYFKDGLEMLKGDIGGNSLEDIEKKIQLTRLQHQIAMEEKKMDHELGLKNEEERKSTTVINTVKELGEKFIEKFGDMFGNMFGQQLQNNMTSLDGMTAPPAPQVQQPQTQNSINYINQALGQQALGQQDPNAIYEQQQLQEPQSAIKEYPKGFRVNFDPKS